VIDLCTPPALHEEHVVRCLDAGFHVVCEKPLVDSVARATGSPLPSSGRRPPQAPGSCRSSSTASATAPPGPER
jgi:hypothetical protein